MRDTLKDSNSCFLIRLNPLVLVPMGLFHRTQSPRLYLSKTIKAFCLAETSMSSAFTFQRLSKSFVLQNLLCLLPLYFKDYQSLLSRLSKSSLHFKDYQSLLSRRQCLYLHFKRLQYLQSFTLSKDNNVFIYISKDLNVFSHLCFQKTTMSSFTFQKTSISSVIYAFKRRQCLYLHFKRLQCL